MGFRGKYLLILARSLLFLQAAGSRVAQETERARRRKSTDSAVKSHSEMAEKSKVLVIGVTALIGKFVVEASAKSGHPTFALVAPPSTPSDAAKVDLVEGFKSLGVHVVLVRSYSRAIAFVSDTWFCFEEPKRHLPLNLVRRPEIRLQR